MKVFKVFVLVKACQFTTIDQRFVKNSDLFPTSTQSNLHKYVSWPKCSGKFIHEWNKACANFKLCPRKLNILMKTR